MAEPLDIQHYIMIETDEVLDKETIKIWFQSVKECAPSGTIASIQTFKEGDGPKAVSLIHRSENDKHKYLVPLTRDLIDEEVDPIFDSFSEQWNGDFDLEVSESHLEEYETESFNQEELDTAYERLAERFAKAMHQRWYESRVEEGWRYGMQLNEDDMTHPMLRPWEQLPESYQDVDYNLPEMFMDILEEEGFVIVEEKELDKLLKKS